MQKVLFRKSVLLCSFVALMVYLGGCKKNVPATPPAPAPAPAPAEPTVTLNASPTSINPGETVTLTWSSTNATDLSITPGVGKVAPEGSTPVTPAESTTYKISATGPGGTAEASASVSVKTGPAEAPTPPGMDELFQANVKDAFFDFNKSDIRADARQALSKTAEFLRSYPQLRVSIEGHCDERGSTEYNLGLGQRRAQAAKDYLVSLGLPADRMETVSWGKERPFCSEHNEECWQSNRRAHFVMIH
jgi:peptidoglycan-associated lipoprotein